MPQFPRKLKHINYTLNKLKLNWWTKTQNTAPYKTTNLKYVVDDQHKEEKPADRVMWKPNPRLDMHARKDRLVPGYENRNRDEHEYYIWHKTQAVQEAFVAKYSQLNINTGRVVIVTAESWQPFSRQTNDIFDTIPNQTSITGAWNVLHDESYKHPSSTSSVNNFHNRFVTINSAITQKSCWRKYSCA